MATYLELSQLANDQSFLARIAYAAGKYAAYITTEAPSAANHAQRLNWALRCQGNPSAMAVSLVAAICRNADVVYGLSAVTDESLQIAVETAANDLLGVAVNYLDLITLATDPSFLRRTQLAVTKFAAFILNEPPDTPNHNPRYQWARSAILNTMGVANSLAPSLVIDVKVAENLLGTSDAQLQSAVEFEALQLLL